VIDAGRKVAEGTPDELKSSVGDSSLQLLLADPTQLAAAAETVRRQLGGEPVLTPERGRITVPLERADRAADVLTALRTAGISLSSMSVQKPSLDEVFLALTGHDTSSDTSGDTQETAA
jgi:ABC-2 type transport system ATP-binding protein